MLMLPNAVFKWDAYYSAVFQFPISSRRPVIFTDSFRGFLSTTTMFDNLRNSLFGNDIPFHANLSTENVVK
jgi:hypothetical protein